MIVKLALEKLKWVPTDNQHAFYWKKIEHNVWIPLGSKGKELKPTIFSEEPVNDKRILSWFFIGICFFITNDEFEQECSS